MNINNIFKFLVIDNFGAFTALLAGAIAWMVYTSQKRDKKINAARIILSEVRLAENRIDIIKDFLDRGVKDFPDILPTNSWRASSYLFASDFDQDQLDEMNKFYDVCEALEDAIQKDANYFWSSTENINREGQKMATKLLYKSLDDKYNLDEKKLEKLKKSVVENISNHPFIYAPRRTLDVVRNGVASFKQITTTATGQKLKEIANIAGRKKYLWVF